MKTLSRARDVLTKGDRIRLSADAPFGLGGELGIVVGFGDRLNPYRVRIIRDGLISVEAWHVQFIEKETVTPMMRQPAVLMEGAEIRGSARGPHDNQIDALATAHDHYVGEVAAISRRSPMSVFVLGVDGDHHEIRIETLLIVADGYRSVQREESVTTNAVASPGSAEKEPDR